MQSTDRKKIHVQSLNIRRGAALLLVSILATSAAACSFTSSDENAESGSTKVTTETESAESKTSPDTSDAETNAALDAYIQKKEEDFASFREVTDEFFSDIAIESEPPGTIHYTFTLTTPLSPEEAQAIARTYAEDPDALAEEDLQPLRKAGISNPRVTYRFLNPDGSEVWSFDSAQ